MTAGGLEVCRIVVTRTIGDDGDDLSYVEHEGDHSLIELLGMLEFAKDSLIRDRMRDNRGDDDGGD